jgi:hypothetical protein
MRLVLTEPFLSVIGGGLAAAVLTFIFNVCWDRRKQKLTEDWEFRRYHANQIHFATLGLTEAFFAAKTEIYFLACTLETLLGALNQLTAQADTIVRQQGGPQLTVAQLEQKKADLLQPFQKYNQEQVALRWNQFEQKSKELQAKAEVHMSVLQPLVPASTYARLLALYQRFATRWVWDLPHAQERLRLYEDNLPELNRIRELLTRQIEVELGRVKAGPSDATVTSA